MIAMQTLVMRERRDCGITVGAGCVFDFMSTIAVSYRPGGAYANVVENKGLALLWQGTFKHKTGLGVEGCVVWRFCWEFVGRLWE